MTLEEKQHATAAGKIVYWAPKSPDQRKPWLVFLPGLTADHRLFDKQVEYFEDKANVLVWDAPNHGASRLFSLSWSLDDKARWLKEILDAEGAEHPILIGQSMGGYVSQAFIDLFPGIAAGFISIDSCPLQRHYYSDWELAALKHTKLMYLSIPWKALVKIGSHGVATSTYGRWLMRQMMLDYEKREYCELAAHGFAVLADAVEADRPYALDLPWAIVCGTEDAAGSAKRYDRAWEEHTGNKIHWIEGAGHNSNCDAPDEVNAFIEDFVGQVALGGL